MALTLISCANRPVQNAEAIYRPGFLQDMKEGVELRVVPAHLDSVPERVRLEITNNTSGTIQYGANYRIEWYDEEEKEWIVFGPPEGTAVIAIMYLLEPGKTQGYDIALFPDKIGYNIPGSYRIVKQIYLPDESRDFSASFLIR